MMRLLSRQKCGTKDSPTSRFAWRSNTGRRGRSRERRMWTWQDSQNSKLSTLLLHIIGFSLVYWARCVLLRSLVLDSLWPLFLLLCYRVSGKWSHWYTTQLNPETAAAEDVSTDPDVIATAAFPEENTFNRALRVSFSACRAYIVHPRCSQWPKERVDCDYSEQVGSECHSSEYCWIALAP